MHDMPYILACCEGSATLASTAYSVLVPFLLNHWIVSPALAHQTSNNESSVYVHRDNGESAPGLHDTVDA